MKNKYTRKQLVEAISYWKNILETSKDRIIDESKKDFNDLVSKLLDEDSLTKVVQDFWKIKYPKYQFDDNEIDPLCVYYSKEYLIFVLTYLLYNHKRPSGFWKSLSSWWRRLKALFHSYAFNGRLIVFFKIEGDKLVPSANTSWFRALYQDNNLNLKIVWPKNIDPDRMKEMMRIVLKTYTDNNLTPKMTINAESETINDDELINCPF